MSAGLAGPDIGVSAARCLCPLEPPARDALAVLSEDDCRTAWTAAEALAESDIAALHARPERLEVLVRARNWLVATKALEILHVDPATLDEMDDACDRACYECLLSYYNQWHHEFLDRKLVIPFLTDLLAADGLDMTRMPMPHTWEELLAGTDCEAQRAVMRSLHSHGFPVPEACGHLIVGADGDPVATVDLLYAGGIAVWVPGSALHAGAGGAQKLAAARGRGYVVVEVDADAPMAGLTELGALLGHELATDGECGGSAEGG